MDFQGCMVEQEPINETPGWDAISRPLKLFADSQDYLVGHARQCADSRQNSGDP